MRYGVVAIVGRVNVGKSTLFNRLVGRRTAIVEGEPGVTRDRVYGICEWQGNYFTLIDTGGLFPPFLDSVTEQVEKQVDLAINEADLILFVVDVVEGITPAEEEIAEKLRKANKPVIIVGNKCDIKRKRWKVTEGELHSLGGREIIYVSALKGEGIGELLDRIVSYLPEEAEIPITGEQIKVAIVGAPNVGKSSLLNAILQEERVIVDKTPGTTRDAIDTPFRWKDTDFLLIDTAGIKRKSKLQSLVEYFALVRAMKAIQRADIAFLVLDASLGVRRADKRVAGYVEDAYKGCIIVANKWDLIREGHTSKVKKAFIKVVREEMPFLSFAPVVFTSALKEEGIYELLDKTIEVYQNYSTPLNLEEIEPIIREAVERNPAREGKKQLKLYEIESDGAKPPSLKFYVNIPDLADDAYLRYIENYLRSFRYLEGTPIRFKLLRRKKKALLKQKGEIQ
ncbi:ribosome biogenesis GTPase Der [bacterium]|nr:ribosome biogenesis GTPase Der [bacterium]